MSMTVQLARGSIANKTLLNGELFWDDSGVLYIGSTSGPTPIAGNKAQGSLSYRGVLYEAARLPENAKAGEFWVLKVAGTGALTGYLAGDWLICATPGNFFRLAIPGDASSLAFNPTGTGLVSTTVQTAIAEVATKTLAYAGTISLATIPASPAVGALYLSTEDFTLTSKAVHKNDLVFFTQGVWSVLAVGSTHATDISYASTTVGTTLDTLVVNKADLVAGKIPVSQLPSSVVGGLHYMGVWDFSTNDFPAGAQTGNYWVAVNPAVVTVGGVDYLAGDFLVYNGATWDKVDNTDQVKGLVVGGQTLTGLPEFVGQGAISVYVQNGKITIDAGASVTAPLSTEGRVQYYHLGNLYDASLTQDPATGDLVVDAPNTLFSHSVAFGLATLVPSANTTSFTFPTQSGQLLADSSVIDCGERL